MRWWRWAWRHGNGWWWLSSSRVGLAQRTGGDTVASIQLESEGTPNSLNVTPILPWSHEAWCFINIHNTPCNNDRPYNDWVGDVCLCRIFASRISPQQKIPLKKKQVVFFVFLTPPKQTPGKLWKTLGNETYTLEKAAEAERDARCLDLAMELKWSRPGLNLGGPLAIRQAIGLQKWW